MVALQHTVQPPGGLTILKQEASTVDVDETCRAQTQAQFTWNTAIITLLQIICQDSPVYKARTQLNNINHKIKNVLVYSVSNVVCL